ncbi:MAG: DUF2061 domain-containing protein [Candidatus Omnitrophota bacterium]
MTWRLFSFFLHLIIIYLYTKNIKQTIGAALGIDIVKLILYYFHERLWNKTAFGRMHKEDYQI